MDITPSITTTTNNTTSTKSPEADSETPTRIQPTKPLSFSNGVLKRHHPHHHHTHHHNIPITPVVVTYKECLKNHAATLGGHALDGCGEFMPSPTATSTDPTSLKCAACGCHRNFHRRDPEDPIPPTTPAATTHVIEYQPHHRHHPPPPPHGGARSPNSASPPPISSSYYPSAPHMLLALSTAHESALAGANNNTGAAHHQPPIVSPSTNNARKRFRTKFSQEQKDKMYQFAERVGWKMQKRDEEVVREFCNDVGVDKGVLKVWMHNNKNTFAKRDVVNGANSGGVGGGDGGRPGILLEQTHHNGNGNGNGNGNNNDDDDDDDDDEMNDNKNDELPNPNHHYQLGGRDGAAAHGGMNGRDFLIQCLRERSRKC